MANFDAQVKESQAQVAEAQAKITELTSRIETARAKMKSGDDAMIDIENATLDDVHAHTDVMNANIAELIMGLDDVTAAFSKDFDEMRNKTGWESFVGVFSKGKSDSMRQERMRTASIDDKLQDLIGKSDVIVQLLEGQLKMLEDQKHQGRRQPVRNAGRARTHSRRTGSHARGNSGHGPQDHRAGKQDRGGTGRCRAHQAGNRTGGAEHQIQRDGAGRTGQAGEIPDAGTLYRKGQDLDRLAAKSGGDADGADQQAADRHQAARGSV